MERVLIYTRVPSCHCTSFLPVPTLLLPPPLLLQFYGGAHADIVHEQPYATGADPLCVQCRTIYVQSWIVCLYRANFSDRHHLFRPD